PPRRLIAGGGGPTPPPPAPPRRPPPRPAGPTGAPGKGGARTVLKPGEGGAGGALRGPPKPHRQIEARHGSAGACPSAGGYGGPFRGPPSNQIGSIAGIAGIRPWAWAIANRRSIAARPSRPSASVKSFTY